MSNAENILSANDASSDEMSLVGHLQELRKRIIISVIAVGISSTISYFYAGELIHYFTAPAGKLYYMNPAEAFFSYLKLSFFVGFLAALPVVFYQTWCFIVPALSKKAYNSSLVLVPASVLLFFLGISFAYFFALPAGIKFFMGFGSEELQPLISLGQYMSFIFSFLLPFGVIFEIPLIILVLAQLGIVNSTFLSDKRKHVVVLSLIIGAVVAPTPDVISQLMIAVPIFILYEISVVSVKYILKK